jgi:hypothetical protein
VSLVSLFLFAFPFSLPEQLEHLMVGAVAPMEAGESIERFRLQYDLKCFNTEILEKRINALTDIDELATMVYAKEDRSFQYYSQTQQTPAKWLTST